MSKKVVGIRFKKAGKIYYFDPLDYPLKQYDHVVVETVQGLEYGEVALAPRDMDDKLFKTPIKPVLRKATSRDDSTYEQVKESEKKAGEVFTRKVKENGLDMRLVNVEYTFDQKKAVFYFTAEGRVDFRNLVKELAAIFKIRIELRQIGARDEVKLFNTLGVCGRDTCCSGWLGDFTPVSIRMAKEQGMTLNSTKISGVCGRLLCCLTYEHDFYKEALKKLPKVGQTVKTVAGEGTVYRLNVLEEKIIVRLEKENGEVEIKPFSTDEILSVAGKTVAKVPEAIAHSHEDDDKALEALLDEEDRVVEEKSDNKKDKRDSKKQNKKNKGDGSKKPKKTGGKPKTKTVTAESKDQKASPQKQGKKNKKNQKSETNNAPTASGQESSGGGKKNRNRRRSKK